MKELNVNGRMMVKTLKRQFADTFGLSLRVYLGQHFADDNSTLASIRREGCAGGELSVYGQMQVGNFENKMLEEFGIKVQVANADDSKLVDNKLTLAAASNGATKAVKKESNPAEVAEELDSAEVADAEAGFALPDWAADLGMAGFGASKERPAQADDDSDTNTYTLTLSGTFYGLQLAKIDVENEAVMERVKETDLSDNFEIADTMNFIANEAEVENLPEMYFYSNCNQCLEHLTVENESGEMVFDIDDLDELEGMVEDNYPSPYDLGVQLRNNISSAKNDGLVFEMSVDNKDLVDYLEKECCDSEEFDACMAALKMDVDSGWEELAFANMAPEIAKTWRAALACEDEERGWIDSATRSLPVIANSGDEDEDSRFLAWMKYYNDATMKFQINLPEGEEFDITKLHLIKEEDWWDYDPFYPEAINEILSDTLGPIEAIEYDGKFYYADKESGMELGRLRDGAAAICDIRLAEANLD